MKEQLNKIASGAAGIGIVLVGCVMAGLGLSVVVFLALFALAVVGLGILAAPLVALANRDTSDNAEQPTA